MFARRSEPAAPAVNGELIEGSPSELSPPPKMLDAFAQRFLGVTMSELQTIGRDVGGFLKEAREKLEHMEAQQTRILALLESHAREPGARKK
jgi:hypothetical protein